MLSVTQRKDCSKDQWFSGEIKNPLPEPSLASPTEFISSNPTDRVLGVSEVQPVTYN